MIGWLPSEPEGAKQSHQYLEMPPGKSYRYPELFVAICADGLQEDLPRHMATGCRNRTVSCIVCKLRARLPDMLRHLRLHRTDIQLKVIRSKREVAASKAAGREASRGVKEEGGPEGELHHRDRERSVSGSAGRSRNAVQLVAAAAEPAEGTGIMAILPCGAGGGNGLAAAVADAVPHSRSMPMSPSDRDAQPLRLLAESSGRSSLSNAGLEPGVDSDRTAAPSSRPGESSSVAMAAVGRRGEDTSLPMTLVAGSGMSASRYAALHRMLCMLTQQVRRRAAAAAVTSLSSALSTMAAAADSQAGPSRSGVASESDGLCTEDLAGAGDITDAANEHEDCRAENEDAEAQWKETLEGTLLDALMSSSLDEDLMASVGEEAKSDAVEEEAVVVGEGVDADDCSPCTDCSDVEMYRYLMQAISGCEVTTKG